MSKNSKIMIIIVIYHNNIHKAENTNLRNKIINFCALFHSKN